MPRDRNGEYEPQIIGKYDRNAAGMEDKTLSFYACGMSQKEELANIIDILCLSPGDQENHLHNEYHRRAA